VQYTLKSATFAVAASALFGAQAFADTLWENPVTPAPAPEVQAPAVEKNLKVFDTLDFDVFSNQKWDRLSESHRDDIVVTWPDGHETKGLDKHIEDLKAMFTFAPDTSIKEHPLRFGFLDNRVRSHDWNVHQAHEACDGQIDRAHRQALCGRDGDRWALGR
jgi:hypothetical protein